MAPERLPYLAGIGLAAIVVLGVSLPQLRDPNVVRALELAAAPARTTVTVEATRDQPADKGDVPGPPVDPLDAATDPLAGSNLLGAKVSDDEIDRASSVEELEALMKRAPKNGRLLKKLARTQAADPTKLKDALLTARAAFTHDPKTLDDKDLHQIVLRAASGQPDIQDLAFEMLRSKMGSVGPDLIYELTTAPSVSANVKKRALEEAKSDEVKENASPALKIAMQLRDVSACERKALLPDAEKHGDKRSLQYLVPMTSNKGCGMFKRSDCYPCMGARVELNQAIKAIQSR